jgi:phosphate transport system substrate-binding protein
MEIRKMGMRNWCLLVLTASFLIVGCGSNQSGSTEKRDTGNSGEIHISVDETYKPLIESEIRVFESLYPKAKIHATYKPEAACFQDLLADSSRLIIVTRELNEEELSYFKSIKRSPKSMQLATDAIALVVNRNNPDSIFTMDQVRQIMAGTYHKNYQIVFDNANSSTVRYIIDSINQGKPLPANTMAAKTNPEVIDFVEKSTNALGVIGVNWISDTDDVNVINFTERIRTVKLRGDNNTDYVQPFQYYIGVKSYPLTRGMFFVINEPYQGLGNGFISFLGSQEGQLIIGKFKLYPSRLNIVFREAKI